MSRRKKKSGLAYALGIVRVLILIPVTYEIIMHGLAKVQNNAIAGGDVNAVMNQEMSSLASVIIVMLVEFFAAYAALEICSIVILRLVNHKD